MCKTFNSKSSDADVSITGYEEFLFVLFSFQFSFKFSSIYWLVFLDFIDFHEIWETFFIEFCSIIHNVARNNFFLLHLCAICPNFLKILIFLGKAILLDNIYCNILYNNRTFAKSCYYLFLTTNFDYLIYLFAKTLCQYTD